MMANHDDDDDDDETCIAFSLHEQKIVLVDIAGNILMIIAAVDSSRISTPSL